MQIKEANHPYNITAEHLIKLINQDQGLGYEKKKYLFRMIGGPETFDHLFVGMIGVALTRAVTNYEKLSFPSKVLLSLAGYGIGNIIYNMLHDRKFTDYDPATGKIRVR